MGSLGLAPIQPQIGVGPLGGYSRPRLLDRTVPGEVPVHQVMCHFPALCVGSLWWVTRRGERR